MRARVRAAFALLGGSAVFACGLPTTRANPASEPAHVLVYYPAGACTAELEIELYDRAAGVWRPHPDHPRLPPGACAREPSGQLLNELRVRCADPSGARRPSPWVVGAELAPTPAACEPASR
jgi:hypothetical protein